MKFYTYMYYVTSFVRNILRMKLKKLTVVRKMPKTSNQITYHVG